MKDEVLTAPNSSSRLFNNCQLNSMSAYASIWHANCESNSGSGLVLVVRSVSLKKRHGEGNHTLGRAAGVPPRGRSASFLVWVAVNVLSVSHDLLTRKESADLVAKPSAFQTRTWIQAKQSMSGLLCASAAANRCSVDGGQHQAGEWRQ